MPPSLRPVPFVFLRHGETDWNARDLSQGRTDIPLNARGLEQARLAGAALHGAGIVTIVASPLSRARVTAEVVGAVLGLPVALDPDLQEVAFGVQEGEPMGDWYDSWIEGRFTPEGGEPFAELLARACVAIDRATALPGPVLVVAHGALFRALRLAFGLAPNLRTPNGIPTRCLPPATTGEPWTLLPLPLPD